MLALQAQAMALKAETDEKLAILAKQDDVLKSAAEIEERAKAKEAHRDRALAAYHMFEYGSACFQLAIVLAGAAALTAVAWLTFVSFGLGAVGIGFTLMGFLAPNLLPI